MAWSKIEQRNTPARPGCFELEGGGFWGFGDAGDEVDGEGHGFLQGAARVGAGGLIVAESHDVEEDASLSLKLDERRGKKVHGWPGR